MHTSSRQALRPLKFAFDSRFGFFIDAFPLAKFKFVVIVAAATSGTAPLTIARVRHVEA
jgi:hypothetical protein